MEMKMTPDQLGMKKRNQIEDKGSQMKKREERNEEIMHFAYVWHSGCTNEPNSMPFCRRRVISRYSVMIQLSTCTCIRVEPANPTIRSLSVALHVRMTTEPILFTIACPQPEY